MIERVKQRWIVLTLAGCLVTVVAALAIVGLINGITLNGDLTYGDLLVGLGTLALAALTAVLADATFGVEKRAAERQDAQRRTEVRAAARVLNAELDIVEETLNEIEKARMWPEDAELPRDAWKRNAEILVADISDDEGLALVKFFSRLEGWTVTISARLRMHAPNDAVDLRPGDSLDGLFVRLRAARTVVRALANE